MGVKGLWKLLEPCGRRIHVETLENTTLAVDVSIWMTQFVKAMRETSLRVSDGEALLLFQTFDPDGSGSVDYEEFLRGVRGGMNERRQGLVRMAFDVIDADGSGVIEPSEIASR